MYPVVDKLNKNKGRPATDRRFQLRFLIWWKFFSPGPQETAVNKLNGSPELQKILEAPMKKYTRSSFRRFLKAIGELGFIKMGSTIVTNLINKGVLDTSKIILDSFPIYSYLNWLKCLKMPKFNRKFAKQFYKLLSLENTVKLFLKQHGRSAPLADKLKAWIHHYLWDIPSAAMNQQFIFGKASRKEIMALEKGWTSVATYRNFLKSLKQLSNLPEVQSTIVTEVLRVLHLLGVPLKNQEFNQIEDLCKVFHKPHRLKDPGISFNYCAAKDQHFMGRGGLLAIFPALEVPFFVQTTPRYKQNEPGILSFLINLNHHHKTLVQATEVYADSEFGTNRIKNHLKENLRTTPFIDTYGRGTTNEPLTPEQRNIRRTIERVIGRLDTQFSLEHPPFLGSEFIAIHTQLSILCDLLLTSFNIFSGNQAHPHSLRSIRG